MFVRRSWCTVLAVMCFGVVATADPGEDFKKHYSAWKSTLSQMRELQARYAVAKDEDKPEMRKRFDDLIVEGNSLVEKVTQAAEAAYQANPNNDSEPAEFISTAASRAYAHEEYEVAYRWYKMLFDQGYSRAQALEPAAGAAFCVNDFDLAEKLFKQSAVKNKRDKQQEPPVEQKWAEVVGQYKKYWEQEKALREKETKADDLPRVKIQTTQGEIVIELFENEAPNTVANFINLVEKKYYDGTPFHRVIRQFMAQGGDPTGTGRSGPGYQIPCECYQPNHRLHFRGTLSMAHAGRDTGGSQFFLTFVPTDHLNGKHTVFGRVVEGMDVLAKLHRTEPPSPGQVDKIVAATVVRKRPHEYVPRKTGQ